MIDLQHPRNPHSVAIATTVPWKSLAKPRITAGSKVITGSMFSGKSEELIRRLRRAQIACVITDRAHVNTS